MCTGKMGSGGGFYEVKMRVNVVVVVRLLVEKAF